MYPSCRFLPHEILGSGVVVGMQVVVRIPTLCVVHRYADLRSGFVEPAPIIQLFSSNTKTLSIEVLSIIVGPPRLDCSKR